MADPLVYAGDRERFPYEPRVVAGRLLIPAELQRIHRFVLDTPVIEVVSDEVRAVVEGVWSGRPECLRFRLGASWEERFALSKSVGKEALAERRFGGAIPHIQARMGQRRARPD